MNYQEFLTTIKTQLSLRIDADATLDIRRFTKNNGTDLDGLIIFRPNLNISPTIYLNPYYHRYLQGVPMEDIYTDILITYQEHLPSEDIDVSFFTDFSKAKKLVTMSITNRMKRCCRKFHTSAIMIWRSSFTACFMPTKKITHIY